MKITLKDIIQTIVSLALGIYVFWLVYSNLDMDEMSKLIKSARWEFVLFPIGLCLLSSLVRALRWNMLIEPIAKKPALKNTFSAVMYGYFVNHLLPRAGEIARCGVLKKYEGISFAELVGTVITERAFDLVTTLLIVTSTVVLEFDTFSDILSGVSIWQSICSILTNTIFWIVTGAVLLLVFLFRKQIMRLKIVAKIKEIAIGVLNGLKSFTKVKNKPLFIIYSLLIFFMYYLMLYFSFWMFDFTEVLGLEEALVTYVFGALGMLVPVQGGIGAYEFMTIKALGIYGIGATAAGTFALFAHLVEIIVTCGVGFGCSLALPFMNKNKTEV